MMQRKGSRASKGAFRGEQGVNESEAIIVATFVMFNRKRNSGKRNSGNRVLGTQSPFRWQNIIYTIIYAQFFNLNYNFHCKCLSFYFAFYSTFFFLENNKKWTVLPNILSLCNLLFLLYLYFS